jgi:hypothetical protein
MKQYLLSVYQPDGPPPDSQTLEKIMRDVRALREEMKAAGAWVFTAGLHPPSTATVVRVNGAKPMMTDGPFAEGKEHIGGFSIIRARMGSQARARDLAANRGSPHSRGT